MGYSDSNWHPSMWDQKQTLRCVRHIALRFGSHPALTAISILNEPSSQIDAADLCQFYCDAYNVIRKFSDVTVVMALYQRDWFYFRWMNFFPPSYFRNVAFDLHLYQCFGDNWQALSLSYALESAKTGEGHWPSVKDVIDSGYPVMVSEWSCRLPEWNPDWQVAKDLNESKNRDKAYALYIGNQLKQFEDTEAWYFWTWKVDAPGANDGRGEPHWDLRECIRRGWVTRARLLA